MFSPDPIRYSDGSIKYAVTDFASDAFGLPWGRTRSWTNQTQSPGITGYHDVAQTQNGNGWFASDLPRLQWEYASGGYRDRGSRIILVNSATDYRYFDRPVDYGTGALTYTSVMGGTERIIATQHNVYQDGDFYEDTTREQTELTYFDANGNQLVFYGESYDGSNGESELRGSIKSFTDTSGHTVNFEYEQVTSATTGTHWRLKAMNREELVDGVNVRESFDYDYVSDNAISPLAGRYDWQFLLRGATWKRGAYTEGQPDTRSTIRSTTYSYWGDSGFWDQQGVDADYSGTQYGTNRDLASAITKDGSGNVIDQYVYRYWTSDDVDFSTKGYAGGLKYVFSPQSTARLGASLPSGTTPFTATDSQVSAFADNYFEYAPFRYNRSSLWNYNQNRVTKEIVQAAGCSCSGGSAQGTYTYSYSEDLKADGTPYYGEDYNVWKFKTNVVAPDGVQTLVYSNFAGMPILSTVIDGGSRTNTFYRYDLQGRVILEAMPSALTAMPLESAWGTFGSSAGVAAGFADIGGYDGSTGDLANVSNTQGLVERWEFAPSTAGTIGESVSGDAQGFIKAFYVQQGDGAGSLSPASKIQSYEYFKHQFVDQSGGTQNLYVLAKSTDYQAAAAGTPEVTSYEYSWDVGTAHLRELRENLPVNQTSKNGDGTADYRVYHFNANGLVNWYRDEDGHLEYLRFDPLTSLPSEIVRDVDTARDSDGDGDDDELSGSQLKTFEDKPAGANWTHAGGANLVRLFEMDALGRTVLDTQAITLKDANHDGAPDDRQVTAIVRDDAKHETRVYTGWTGTSAAGTVTVSREYRPAANAPTGQQSLYYETAVVNVTPAVSNGLPTGAESFAAADVTSLSRSITNAGGIVTRVDQYTSLSGVTYTAASAQLGSKGTNYLETVQARDSMGRDMMVTSPDGTIRWKAYDALGRLTSVWLGTNSTSATPSDPTGGGATGNNMVEVASYTYDADGNQLTSTQIADGTHAYTTTYQYDFRDRLIGQVGPDGVGTRYTLDNQGNQTRVETFANTMVNTDGTLNYGAASNLRGRVDYAYDDQGRVYRTTTYNVDPSNGAVGDSIAQNMWYDRRGDVVKVASANGLFQKTTYDGVGRAVSTYASYDDDETTWAEAGNVDGDTVISQQDVFYVGNYPVITASYDRTAATGIATGRLSPTTAWLQTSVTWYDNAGRVTGTGSYGTDPGRRVLTSGGAIVDANSDGVPDAYAAGVPTTNTASGQLIALLAKTAYDAAGRVLSTTDNKGHVTRYGYDLLGRKTSMIANYVDGVASETESDTDQTTKWIYDAWGRLYILRALNPQGSGLGVQQQDTQYFYGSDVDRSWVTTTIYPDSAVDYDWDASGKGFIDASSPDTTDDVADTFDRLGRKTTSTDQRGVVHVYSYDAAGRLSVDSVTSLGRSDQNVDGSVRAIGTTYDDLGRTQSVTSYSNTDLATSHIANQVKTTYDGWGNVIKSQQSHSGAVTSGTPSVGYAYDDGSVSGVAKYVRLSAVTYPNGRQVDYTYGGSDEANDKLSRIYQISEDGSGSTAYDARFFYAGTGTIVREMRDNGHSKLDYDPSNDGAISGFDRFGRIVGQTWSENTTPAATTSTWAADDATAYAYDADSNRTNRVSTTNGAGISDPNAYQQSYAYDGLDRLTSSVDSKPTTSGGTTTWTTTNGQAWGGLDALGNWRSSSTDTNGDGVADTTQTRTNNAANEITGVSGSTWGDPTYDAAGNQTRLPPAAGSGESFEYAYYDAWNRMTSVEIYNTPDRERGDWDDAPAYSYDGLGRKIAMVDYNADGSFDAYFDENWQELERRDGFGGGTSEQNVWDPRYVDALIRQDKDVVPDNGSLDTGFGTGGHVVLDASGSSINDSATSMVVQPDGKVLVSGAFQSTYGFDAYVARYNADGTVDASFGTNGVYRLNQAAYISAQALTLGTDGKIYFAGHRYYNEPFVARLNANGTIDTTYGSSGFASDASVSVDYSGVTDMAIDSSGRAIVVGGVNGNWFVARFKADGSGIDTTFGAATATPGRLNFNFTSSSDERALGITLDANGKLVVCGVSGDYAAIARLNADGTFDTTFDSDGKATFREYGTGSVAFRDVAIDANGKIVLAGGGVNTTVTRLNADGSLDTTFDGDGYANTNVAYGGTDAETVAIQPDGKIVVGGYAGYNAGFWRFNANGSLDYLQTLTTGSSTSSDDWKSIAVDGDHVYLAGVSDYNSSQNTLIAKYNAGPGLEATYVQQDANYDVTSITDDQGRVIERYRYTAYGERTVLKADGTAAADPTTSRYGFAIGHQGGRIDAATGLINFRHREYSASLGRWVSRDSEGYIDGHNLFQSWHSNPPSVTDAMGTTAKIVVQGNATTMPVSPPANPGPNDTTDLVSRVIIDSGKLEDSVFATIGLAGAISGATVAQVCTYPFKKWDDLHPNKPPIVPPEARHPIRDTWDKFKGVYHQIWFD